MKPAELAAALEAARAETEAVLDGLTEAQLTQPGAAGDWAVKDVLAHVTAWEAELVTGLAKVRQGRLPGKTNYTPDEIQAQNTRWHAENQGRPLARVLADFRGVRKQTLRQIRALTEQDLNAPRPWLRQGTVVDWVNGWVLEHEVEHTHHLAQWRRGLGAPGTPAGAG
jgi:uncharacterized protein (TIGR03083 family)